MRTHQYRIADLRPVVLGVLGFWIAALPLRAADPYFSVDVDWEDPDRTFHIETHVGNTKQIVVNFYQGATAWTATGWTPTFRFGKKRNSSMVAIIGTVSGSVATIDPSTSNFARPVKKWFASITMTKSGDAVDTIEGTITIRSSSTAAAALTFSDPGLDFDDYSESGTLGDTAEGVILTNITKVTMSEISAPSTPSADTVVIYIDSADGDLKAKDDNGEVVVIGNFAVD